MIKCSGTIDYKYEITIKIITFIYITNNLKIYCDYFLKRWILCQYIFWNIHFILYLFRLKVHPHCIKVYLTFNIL